MNTITTLRNNYTAAKKVALDVVLRNIGYYDQINTLQNHIYPLLLCIAFTFHMYMCVYV